MAQKPWKSLLPILGLGGLVLRSMRGAADPGPGEGDPPDENEPPVVWITNPNRVDETLTIEVDETVSSDPDGTIESYQWVAYERDTENVVDTDTGTFATLTVPEPGEYVAEVTATDDDGASSSDTYTFFYGGEDAPNEPPTVSISEYSISGSELSISATANDPDGFIAEYSWGLIRNNTPVDSHTTSTSSTTLSLGGDGSYRASVTVRDNAGKSASDAVTFDYDSGGGGETFDHRLQISKDGHTWVNGYPTTHLTLSATGDMKVSGFVDDGDWSPSGNLTTPLESGQGVTVEYDGSIDLLNWDTGPLTAFRDGERVDLYDLTDDGPRYRWTDGNTDVLEATVYQSAEQYAMQGRESSKTTAEFLHESLKTHNISHDILYSLPVIDLPSESTRCNSPFGNNGPCYGSNVCDDWECCDIEDMMPSALYWWRWLVNDDDAGKRFRENSGTEYRVRGDAFVQRKDSNIILTAESRGGCGTVTGNVCAASGAHIGSQQYAPDASSSDFIRNIHAAMHEFGHNMGYSHPSYEDDCPTGGGEAWIDSEGRWNRTPCVPGNGCTNRCETFIPDRSNTTSHVVIYYPTFTDCTAKQFRSGITAEFGNAVGFVSNGPVVDCADESFGCSDCC